MYYFEINQRVSVSQSRTVRYRFALVILIWVPEAIVDVVVRKGFNTGNEMLNRENLRLFLLGLLFTPTRLPYSMILILDIWVFFPSPTSQISDISWVSSNLAKIWCYLPGDRIRSHRLRLSPTGTPLAVQWLRLWAANAGGAGLIPGWGTKIPHALQRDQIIKTWDFPSGSEGKESTCNVGDPGSTPESGGFLWRREWLPTLVFLPGESQGQMSLEGSSPWGHKESDMTEWLTLLTSLSGYWWSWGGCLSALRFCELIEKLRPKY